MHDGAMIEEELPSLEALTNYGFLRIVAAKLTGPLGDTC